MKPSDHLRAAKAMLTEETWGKGSALLDCNGRKLCPVIALNRVPFGSLQTFRFFTEAVGCDPASIPRWNDSPERTLAQVHEAFDAAIVLAERDEAGLDSFPQKG